MDMPTVLYMCTNEQCRYVAWTPFAVCPKCNSAASVLDLSKASTTAEPASVQTDQEWIELIAQNDSLWYMNAFEAFPSVVAHEYWRLRELCRQNQPYGVLFQIRDLIEATLKYQVLAVCAWACHAQVPHFREQICSAIAEPGMVLGRWSSLGYRIEAFFKRDDIRVNNRQYHMPRELWQSLQLVLSFYEENKMVNWRNERIGHGALGFSQDAAFRRDVENMLACFKRLYDKLNKNYRAQVLFVGNQELRGSRFARNLTLPEEHGPLSLRLVDSGVSFSVEPYMLEVKGGIYFFDNQKSRMLSQMLCYPLGRRENRQSEYFSNLFDMRPRVDTGMTVDGMLLSSREEELIDALGTQTAFVEPEHLTRWLRDALNQHEKGVFLLKMCRGTGKTTYSEKLSSLNENPFELSDDLDVRTYHIVRTQMVNAWDFEHHIEHLWTTRDATGTDWTRAQRIAEYRLQGYKPAEALALFLEQCLLFTRMRRRKERILLIIDGLDEIAEEPRRDAQPDGEEPLWGENEQRRSGESIWDYLPEEAQLPDGVYLLLTSRDPAQEQQDLPEDFRRRIAWLNPTQERSVALSSEENRTFLKAYLTSARLGHLNSREQQQLIEQADHRVLYFGMLCKLLKAGETISSCSTPEEIAASYLNVLSRSYGDKESAHLRELLSILCTLGRYEPLSLDELAWLTGNGQVTIDLISKISDLTPMLKIERGFEANQIHYAGKNRYSPANEGLVAAVHDLLPESVPIVWELIRTALIIAKDAMHDDALLPGHAETMNLESVSALLVLAHLHRLASDIQPERQRDRHVPLSDLVSVEEAYTLLDFIAWTEGMPEEEPLTNARKVSALQDMYVMAASASEPETGWAFKADAPKPDAVWAKFAVDVLLALRKTDFSSLIWNIWNAEWSSEAAERLARADQMDEALHYLRDCIAFTQNALQEPETDDLRYNFVDLRKRYADYLENLCCCYAAICAENETWEDCLRFCEQSPNDFPKRSYFMHKSLVFLGSGINDSVMQVMIRDWHDYLTSRKLPSEAARLGAYFPFVRLFQERIADDRIAGREQEACALDNALADILLDGWHSDLYENWSYPNGMNLRFWLGFKTYPEGPFDDSAVNILNAFARVCKKRHSMGQEALVRDILTIFRMQIDMDESFGTEQMFWKSCDLFEKFGCYDFAIDLLRSGLLQSGCNRGNILFALARQYKNSGQFETALNLFEESLSVRKDPAAELGVSSNVLMADILAGLGRVQEAAEHRCSAIQQLWTYVEPNIQEWKAGHLGSNMKAWYIISNITDSLLTIAEQQLLLGERQAATETLHMTDLFEQKYFSEDAQHRGALLREKLEVQPRQGEPSGNS